jgi:hypothetical protein
MMAKRTRPLPIIVIKAITALNVEETATLERLITYLQLWELFGYEIFNSFIVLKSRRQLSALKKKKAANPFNKKLFVR